jgi:hypothetical protein
MFQEEFDRECFETEGGECHRYGCDLHRFWPTYSILGEFHGNFINHQRSSMGAHQWGGGGWFGMHPHHHPQQEAEGRGWGGGGDTIFDTVHHRVHWQQMLGTGLCRGNPEMCADSYPVVLWVLEKHNPHQQQSPPHTCFALGFTWGLSLLIGIVLHRAKHLA